jgi:hypothetical protein
MRGNIMPRTTLAELLERTAEDMASPLDLPRATAEQRVAEPVYAEDLEPSAVPDAFAWGRTVGALEERYRIVESGRLIAALQRRLGQTWVRF